MDFLSGGEVQEVEREISPDFCRAVAIHNQRHSINPGRLVEALAGNFTQQGGRILLGEVEQITNSARHPVMIDNGLDIAPIITHRYSVGEFQQGFDVMRSGEPGKVILGWES